MLAWMLELRTMRDCLVLGMLCLIAAADADLLVVENGLKPWPSGHGEEPPPIGSLVRVDVSLSL